MKFKLAQILIFFMIGFFITGCSSSDTPKDSAQTEIPQENVTQEAQTEDKGLDLGPYIGTNIDELVPKFDDLNKASNPNGYISYSTPSDTVFFSSDDGDKNIDGISIEYDYDYNIYGLKCFMSDVEAKELMNQICDDVEDHPDEHYMTGIYRENVFKPRIDVSFHHGEVYFVSIALQKQPQVQATERDFIFPDSDSRYIEESELDGLTSQELAIARNEISARRGRIFNKEWLRNYFNSKSWYKPQYDPEDFDENAEKYLSEVERTNMQTILGYEKKKGTVYE